MGFPYGGATGRVSVSPPGASPAAHDEARASSPYVLADVPALIPDPFETQHQTMRRLTQSPHVVQRPLETAGVFVGLTPELTCERLK